MKTDTEKTQHTPGPWAPHLGRGANPRFHIQTEGGYQIASTPELVRHSQAFDENAQKEANARLIAAAPDLLAALEYILSCEGLANVHSRNMAEEAIAKAKGEA